ncbi:hypothetical protein HYFRA_00010094 [Hymenoscyphus fraxineus]|uniref:Uncharacterized protein n=1 Tax=Hymenoscyphus fraxineus TaxID=746836 RepID=A0A9N9KSZ4_9HELO|nr:hypothetical protein HYFRA_00010094 [Hymenoscyphus fraxineus]
MASTIKLAVMKLLQRLDYRLSTTISSHNKSTVTDSENLIPETIEAFGDIKIGIHLIPNLALVLLRGQKHDQEFENESEISIHHLHTLSLEIFSKAQIPYTVGFDVRSQNLRNLLEYTSGSIDHLKVEELSSSLCESWWNGNVVYEHGHPETFSFMLFSSSVALIDELTHDGKLFPSQKYVQRVPIILCQMLTRLISAQNKNGSWGLDDNLEATTYATLALHSISSFQYTHVLETEIKEILIRAGTALTSLRAGKFDSLVNGNEPGMESILEAYSLVAIESTQAKRSTVPLDSGSLALATKISGFAKWFSATEYLRGESSCMIKTSILEASFYRPILQDARTKIFPQTNAKEGDKYMEYIPIMWVIPSTCRKSFLSPEYILDMVVLSMWIFLVDEYMESNVIHFSDVEFAQFRSAMNHLSFETPENGFHDFDPEAPSDPASPGELSSQSTRLEEAISVFTKFIAEVLSYTHVVNASSSDRYELRLETVKYLLYHVTQLEDNIRFSKQNHEPGKNSTWLTPKMPYHTWVHTVGAGHVSGPFGFAFLSCLLGGSVRKGRDCFGTITQKLIAFKMNSHIGSFCRIYNDYGSVVRDREECNINSINFPEFFSMRIQTENNDDPVQHAEKQAKKALLEAGIFERKFAIQAAEILYDVLGEDGSEGNKISDAVRVYMGGCEQFSDLYLTRDVTNTVK